MQAAANRKQRHRNAKPSTLCALQHWWRLQVQAKDGRTPRPTSPPTQNKDLPPPIACCRQKNAGQRLILQCPRGSLTSKRHISYTFRPRVCFEWFSLRTMQPLRGTLLLQCSSKFGPVQFLKRFQNRQSLHASMSIFLSNLDVSFIAYLACPCWCISQQPEQ